MRAPKPAGILMLYLLALASIGYGYGVIELKPVASWDEARRGINAQQMRQFQDYWNYRYLGEYDNFNTKPPLFTWLVAAAFEGFGVNRTALRLGSLLGYAVFILVVLRFLIGRFSWRIAVYCLLILIGVSGVLGDHVALSGDTDMLFVLFTTLGVLSYYRWVCEQKGGAGYAFVLWIALAFLTKGVAVLLVLPGIGLHYFRYRKTLPGRELITPGLGYFALLVSGIVLSILLGFQHEGQPWYRQNLLWDMLARDGVTRFTDDSFEGGYRWDYVFVALDLKFQLFIYLLYALIACAVFKVGLRHLPTRLKAYPFLGLMLFVFGAGMFLLLLSQNKHQWYVAPLIFPLSFVTAFGIDWVQHRYRYVVIIPCLLFLVLAVQRVRELRSFPTGARAASSLETSADTLYLDPATPQNCVFALQQANPSKWIFSTSGMETEALRKKELVICPGEQVFLPE